MSFFKKALVAAVILCNTFYMQIQNADFSKYAFAAEEVNPPIAEMSAAEKEASRIPASGKIEMKEMRTQYSKTYLKSDGSKEFEASQSPMHYQDDLTGNWQEIDSDIVAVSDQFGPINYSEYANKNNDFELKIATDIDSKMFSLNKDGGEISIRPQDVSETLNIRSLNLLNGGLDAKQYYVGDNFIEYKDVYVDTDIKVYSTDSGVKEEIILKHYTGKNIFRYDLGLDGVDFRKNDDGSYDFYKSGTDEFLYRMPRFFMQDSKGGSYNIDNSISYDIECEIVKNDEKFEIVVTADDNWLSSPDRVYPVIIDPTFDTLLSLEDTYIQSGYPSSRYLAWNQALMYVGNMPSLPYYKGVMRAFILFGVPDLTNARINYARLSVLQNGCTGGSACSNYVDAYLTSPFNPYDIYWDNATNNPIYSNGGQPYARTASDTNWGWLDFDVKQAVIDWYKYDPNSVQRGGFQLFNTDWGQTGWRTWIARNHPNHGSEVPDDQKLAPRLYIDYNDYNAEYYPSGELSAVAGTMAETSITVRNTGRNWWGASNVGISYQLIDNSNGNQIITDGEYTSLPRDVAPGGDSVSVLAKVKVPPSSGDYTIRWNLKQPGVTWFSDQGISTASQTLRSSMPSFSSTTHLGNEEYYPMVGPVDITTGNMYFATTDMAVPSNSGGLGFTRSYNSIDATLPHQQDESGFIKNWLINGIYKESDPVTRLTKEHLGEDAAVRPNQGIASGKNLWFACQSPIPELDIRDVLWKKGVAQHDYMVDSSVYAHNYVYSPTARNVYLKVGSDDGLRVWLNSDLVFDHDYGRPVSRDENIISVKLVKGWNSLMFKVSQYQGSWQLVARFTNLHGYVMRDMKYALNNPEIMSAQSILGDNWFTSLEERVTSLDGKSIFYKDATGTVNIFYQQVDGSYTRPAGVSYDMKKGSQGYPAIIFKDGSIKQFYKYGRLRWTIDALGNRTEYVYNDKGQCTQIFDGNRKIDFSYNDLGYLSKATNQLGHSYEYIYEEVAPSKLRLQKINYPIGTSHSYGYQSATDNKITAFTDPKGNKTIFSYSTDNKVTTITNALEEATRFEYSSKHTEVIDALGRRNKYDFNEANLVTHYSNAKNYKEFYQYDRNYNLMSATPELPENDQYYYKYSYSYDSNDNLLSETDPLGNTARYYYQNNDLIKSVTAEGETTTYVYADNATHLMTSMTDPEGATVSYRYDFKGRVLCADDSRGQRTRYTYSDDGDLLTELTPKGELTTYTYDAIGRMTSGLSPLGNGISYKYNRRSQVSQIINSSGLAQYRYYDGNGNLVKETAANSTSKYYYYDALDRLVKSVDETGATVRYEYDKVGNRTKVTDAKGKATTLQYDELDQIFSKTDPLGNVTLLTYDRNGNIVAARDENGQTSTSAYNKAGQVTSNTSANGTTNYQYDNNGSLLSATNSGESSRVTYDDAGKVTQVTSNVSGNNNFYYGADSVLNRSQTKTNNINYTYDANGAVSSVTNSNYGNGVLGKIMINRDAEGKITSWQNKNGDISNYTYDNSLRITQVKTDNKPNHPIWNNLKYSYDNVSNVTKIDDYFKGISNYSYDARSELTSDPDADYQYDAMGNMTKRTFKKGGEVTYAYDEGGDANRLISSTSSDENITYQYDKTGNVIKKISSKEGTTNYTYDSEGYFTKAALPNGTQVEYVYDKIAKHRIERRETSSSGEIKITKFVYDGDKLVSETDSSGNILISYTWDENENLASFSYRINGSLKNYFYIKNAKGDIAGISDEWGQHLYKYYYDSWGNLTATWGVTPPVDEDNYLQSDDNPRLYGGYWYDKTIDLYFMKTRMYDPSIGRFLSPDSATYGITALDLNPYLYCGNNPINRLDPDGKAWWNSVTQFISNHKSEIVEAAVGIAVGVAVGALIVGTGGLAAAVIVGAIAGAAGSLAGYTVSNWGNLSWAGAGKAALTGAVAGAIGGAIGYGVGKAIQYAGKAVANSAAGSALKTAVCNFADVSTLKPAASQIKINASNGREFEKAALGAFSLKKNSQFISGRIPDAISGGQIFEAKGVNYLSNSPQLRTFTGSGIPVNLIVKQSTTISKPLQDSISNTGGKIYRIIM